MDLTIAGTQASYPTKGRANPAYIIKENSTSLLLDIGNGSLSKIFSIMDPADLNAVIISHLHIDHFGDIFPLRLYLYFEKKKKIKLYLPVGGKEKLGCILSDHGRDIFNKAFDFIEIKEGIYPEGDFTLEFKQVCHLEPTFGVKVTSNEKSLVYSADSETCSELVELSKEADALLAEATFLEDKFVKHMTAVDAGNLASNADCEKLILTHIWPSLDPEKSRKIAAQYFKGPIGIAKEGDVFRI